MEEIKKIVVVGGGTAGWLTATLLVDRIPHDSNIKIVLIESKDIPIIGVGESTTGQLPYTIKNSTYLDELEFLKETGSTFKYGIKHSDWSSVGESFNSPLLPSWRNETRYPHDTYDYLRIFHLSEKKSVDNFYHSKCMNQNKVFHVKGDSNSPYSNVVPPYGERLLQNSGYGYHIDAYKAGAFFRKKALNTGKIQRIEATIESVQKDEKGFVTELSLSDGSSVEADLFFDCSGFKRLLKDKNNKFVSYKNQLLVDTALIIPRKYDEKLNKIRTYTHAKAMKFGWMFEIPLQERLGRGYNFSSKHTTKEDAHQELEESLGEEVDVKSVISFEPGRLEKFWDKNVVFVGIASGFLEPLEATTIHIGIKQVEHFLEEYFTKFINLKNNYLQTQFNDSMTKFYDDNRDFLVYHYQHTRQDTDFWKDSSKGERLSDKLKNNMRIWKERTPRLSDFSESNVDNSLLLGTILYYNIAIGMGSVKSELAKKELEYYGLYKIAKEDYENIRNFGDYLIQRSSDSNRFYELLQEGKVSY